MTAGDHVPTMLLLEVVDNVKDCPTQRGDICVKVGMVAGVMVTTMGLTTKQPVGKICLT